ncbi:MAG: polyribonucleotide nucleotidyltransferase [Chloroflexi bacterium]|nr:polyribonucleotide nucleotidyltransferase [Chloroflexota bacterium]
MTQTKVRQYRTKIGDHEIIIETGKLAQQAGGAVTVQSDDTIVLVTATMSREPRGGISFFPLTVDFEERLYAAGKIPGSFFRREGRPTEAAILTARLLDRPLRPLFPKDFRNDVQVIATPLSADQENAPDILALIGASAALMISDVPFNGPVGAIRVSLDDDGELIFNPTIQQAEESNLDLRLAGTAQSITMVECASNEVDEETMLKAMEAGHQAMQSVIALQEKMREEIGKPKREYLSFAVDPAIEDLVRDWVGDRLVRLLREQTDRHEQGDARRAIGEELVAQYGETYDPSDLTKALQTIFKETVRREILESGRRPDGRDTRTIRPLSAEVGLTPRGHGSGLFSRGETQVLTIATFGTPREEQSLDGLSPKEAKRYMHHYNFPPFSTGETWPMRGPKRREVGHGALAEAALRPMIPPEDTFPYTLRLVSEVLSSNGSTSMASVCASTLALMDAGVPIKAPVGGIAMGLVTDRDGRYRVLTDIQGAEDALGDMDFKVAGTRNGINALQMDIKVQGISQDILHEALAQAKEARLQILDVMQETIQSPRPEMSDYAPRITVVKVDPEKIGKIIGPGGKMVRSIQEQTGVKIDIGDEGVVYIASADGPSALEAQKMVEALVEVPEIGKVYTGKVVRVTAFGAFVEIIPGTDGLVHISQLADFRVNRVEDVAREGDELTVMVIDISPDGKIKLSRQAILEGWTAEEARKRDRKPTGRGGSDRGGRRPPRRDNPRGGQHRR